MRRQTPVASLLYSHLFPTPGHADPPNFQIHLARDLIPEIRIETATFYGSLDSIEARYPGLNYCHGPHRMRLGRFPHHARLFETIDQLGITDQEVLELARWEGTLWARQRFERDEGIKVRDTTGDGIMPWVDPRLRKRETDRGIRVKVETAVEVTQDARLDGAQVCMNAHRVEEFIDDDDEVVEESDDAEDNDNDEDLEMDTSMDRDSDETIENTEDLIAAVNGTAQRLGQDIHRRIQAALAARDQGDNVNIPPELEAFLKELVESGHYMASFRPADGLLVEPSMETVPTTLHNGSTIVR